MAISAELQARYTTEVDIDFRNAFVLSHPNTATLYLIDHYEQYEGIVDGFPRLFQPVSAEIKPPGRTQSGAIDGSISWTGFGNIVIDYIYQVIAGSKDPIKCRHSIYILGDPTPQINPWIEFNLTNTSITEEVVNTTISRTDIINKPFPNEYYRLTKFPGLRRR